MLKSIKILLEQALSVSSSPSAWCCLQIWWVLIYPSSRSFMKVAKSPGPKNEPWGIPLQASLRVEVVPLRITCCGVAGQQTVNPSGGWILQGSFQLHESMVYLCSRFFLIFSFYSFSFCPFLSFLFHSFFHHISFIFPLSVLFCKKIFNNN